MKLEITTKKENKLLKRTEIEFTIDHRSEATPSRVSIRDSIAGKLGCDAELVVISKFKTTFGEGKSQGLAHQYKNSVDLNSIEPKYIIKRYAEKPVEKKEEAASSEQPAKGEKSEEAEVPVKQENNEEEASE